jgi:hypothetical protein
MACKLPWRRVQEDYAVVSDQVYVQRLPRGFRIYIRSDLYLLEFEFQRHR